MKKFIIYSAFILLAIACFSIIRAISAAKAHDFSGKCLFCHTTEPDKDAKRENLAFRDEIDNLCAGCHTIDKQKSHPINIRPDKIIPLAGHLNKKGLITCSTCHDVHKEDKTTDKSENASLLWGHSKGRAFCSICHNETAQSASGFRHQGAAQSAHPYGKLKENEFGGLLDKSSTECLSCHDGTFSKSAQVEVRQGFWQHGIGLSHPIGVDYPDGSLSEDFTPPEALPKEIMLFNGKIGCLSCHNLYTKEKYMLVINNRRSELCLACHKK